MRAQNITNRSSLLAFVLCAAAFLSGCGMPAAPQPPSLKLPERVTDLAALRTGNAVSLTWTMPKRDTDKVALKGAVTARVCRGEDAAHCTTAATLEFAPGADGSFKETLPAEFASGAPRALNYYVELVNKRGRSAGLSNAATILTGQAPAPVAGLSAEIRKDGMVLRWTPGPTEPFQTEVRLERTLLTPAKQKSAQQGPLTAPPEPAKQNLLVPAGQVRGRVLDKDVRFGESYSYRAQRVTMMKVAGKTLELAGEFSPPVRVEASDIFPPEVPAGLAAVAMPAANGSAAAIDLSWQPDTETTLAGYAVYRRDAEADAAWQRVSGAQPVVGPGFRDANVQPGHTYEYAVTAIGQNGHESEHSAATQETVP